MPPERAELRDRKLTVPGFGDTSCGELMREYRNCLRMTLSGEGRQLYCSKLRDLANFCFTLTPYELEQYIARELREERALRGFLRAHGSTLPARLRERGAETVLGFFSAGE